MTLVVRRIDMACRRPCRRSRTRPPVQVYIFSVRAFGEQVTRTSIIVHSNSEYEYQKPNLCSSDCKTGSRLHTATILVQCPSLGPRETRGSTGASCFKDDRIPHFPSNVGHNARMIGCTAPHRIIIS